MRDIRRQASSKRTLVASYGGQELESAVLYFEDCIMRDIKESQLTEACRDTSQLQNCWNMIDQSRRRKFTNISLTVLKWIVAYQVQRPYVLEFCYLNIVMKKVRVGRKYRR